MKKKILFIIPSMRGGGAERVILTILKHLPREQFKLNLALVEKVGPYLDEIPDDITVFDLEAGRVRYAVPKIIKLINKIRPDIVFSTLGHLNIALVLSRIFWKKPAKVVIREGSIVSVQNLVATNPTFLWNILYRMCYPKADKIICQSKAMVDDLINIYKVPEDKTSVIYNPIDIENISSCLDGSTPYSNQKVLNVIGIGRLAKEKAFDKLIEAFPQLLKHKEAKLWILGEGPLLDELKKLSFKLNIAENIGFVGFQKNPYTWMAHADLFVLSSIYEGLPNVLLEAMACGCPVVSLGHPGGTREVFEITGQLDRYVTELTWEDKWFEKPFPQVRQKLEEHFGLKKVIAQYVNVFNDLL